MAETKEIQKQEQPNALSMLAARLNVNPEELKKTLVHTVMKPQKRGDSVRPATESEFMSFIIVANAYGLNPLTKEIYAYPDTKSDGIVPVVSVDGWIRIIVNHPKYKNHSFVYSDEEVTMANAKPCPKWIECIIEKTDGSKTVTREYLDECFQGRNFSNPWQSHTKRMLRHKTLIQAGRYTFGLVGIYDEDEAMRIIDAQAIEVSGKPVVGMPKAIGETAPHNGSKYEEPREDMGMGTNPRPFQGGHTKPPMTKTQLTAINKMLDLLPKDVNIDHLLEKFEVLSFADLDCDNAQHFIADLGAMLDKLQEESK